MLTIPALPPTVETTTNPDLRLLLESLDRQSGRADKAIGAIAESLSRNAANAEFFLSFGDHLLARGRAAPAIGFYRRAIQINPDLVPAHLQLGRASAKTGDVEQAIGCFRHVLAIQPSCAAAHAELATLLDGRNEPEMAAYHLRQAVQLEPEFAVAHVALGEILQRLGQLDEAQAALERGLRLRPFDVDARLLQGLLDLRRGNWESGWHHYEWRWRGRRDARTAHYPQKRWKGLEPQRHAILVRPERRLVDNLLFASCLPNLIAVAHGCVIQCDAPLRDLLARSFPQATVLSKSLTACMTALADRFAEQVSDAHIFIGSLPQYFRNSDEAFPRQGRYLKPDPTRVRIWQAWLDEFGPEPKVGVVCPLGRTPESQERELEQLAGIPGVRIVLLHSQPQSEQIQTLLARHDHLHCLKPPSKSNFDELAALLSATDMIVAPAGVTAHLASAVGTRTCVLVPRQASWRWLEDGGATPWHPGARLFRETSIGGREEVISQLCAKLKKWSAQ